MSELSPKEIRDAIAAFRTIEQACKESGVRVAELETELADDSHPAPVEATVVRRVVCRIINNRNLRQAVRKTNMPGSVYLDLQHSIEATGTAGVRHRDPRVLSSDEWADRGEVACQGNLFDEPEPVAAPHKGGIEWDDDGKPFA